MDYIWPREVLSEPDWQMKRRYTVTQWSLVARRGLFRMGPRYGRRACSVNRLRWLRMVCVDIRPSWRPSVSATVLVDGFHWSQRCLGRICQSFDGAVPGGSPLGGCYSLLEWSASAIPSLQVITDIQMRGLIKPHKWKCLILIQFHGDYVIHVWQFRYGQERRQWE